MMMPLILVAFSYLVQPAQIWRYAIPAILAFGPLIALITKNLNQVVIYLTLIIYFIVGLGGPISVYKQRANFRSVAPIVSGSIVEMPLVVHTRHVGYPLFRYSGIEPNSVRISFLFREEPLSRFDQVEKAVAIRMAELFDLPRTIELDDLASLDSFYLLVNEGEESRYEGWNAELVESFRVEDEDRLLRIYFMNKVP